MFELVFRNEIKETRYDAGFFKRIIDGALKELKLENRDINLSLSLVSDIVIQKLNKEHRGKDKSTDVLSFPILKLDNLDGLPEENGAIIDLGDIFISIKQAEANAQSSGMTLENQLAFLVVHGLLHLLGFDHERSPEDEKKMFEMQAIILNKVGSNS